MTCEACGEVHPAGVRIMRNPTSAHELVAEAMQQALDEGRDATFGNTILFRHFLHEARRLGYRP